MLHRVLHSVLHCVLRCVLTSVLHSVLHPVLHSVLHSVLEIPEAAVDAIWGFEERLVRTLLSEAAAVEDQDAMCVPHRRESVGHQHACAPAVARRRKTGGTKG